MVRIETAQLLVRVPQDSDRACFCRLFADAEAMKFVGPVLSTAESTRFFLSALRANARRVLRNLYLTIELQASAEVIGFCSVQRVDRIHKKAELGLMLEPRWHFRRLGSELLPRLIDTAFEHFSVQELEVHYHLENGAARRLFSRCGFMPRQQPAAEVGVLAASAWRSSR